LPHPFRQHEVLVEDDHRREVRQQQGGGEERAERDVVEADSAGRLGDLLVHFGIEFRGGVGLGFEYRGHSQPPRRVTGYAGIRPPPAGI